MDHLPIKRTHRDPDSGLEETFEFAEESIPHYSDGERKPLQSFEEADLEEAICSRPKPKSWWDKMAVTTRGRYGTGELMGGITEGLLASPRSPGRSTRRKRSLYNFCIFGGIGGSMIL